MSRSLAIAAATVLVGVVATLVLPSAAAPTAPGRNGLIAFVSLPAQGIAVVRSDGGGFRQLTRDRRDRSPAWSPDGRRLAFERAGRIYLMAADGTSVRRLMPPSARGRQAAWSPNGREIAFIRTGALFVVRADGTRQRLLYRRKGVVANRPTWSPDGRRIAFGVTDADLDEQGGLDYGSILVIGRGGGPARRVTDGRGEPSDPEPGTWAHDRGPDWSPDGARILFTRLVWLCPRCDQDEVFSVKPDGSEVVWITKGWSWAPAWAPDGTRFVAVTANGLEIFSVDGERLATLRRPGAAPAWQPLPAYGSWR